MSDDIKALIEAQGTAFEEFKKSNDEQIANLKKNGVKDPLTEEKLAKLNETIAELDATKSRLDEMEKKANRLGDTGGHEDKAKVEHKAAFDQFVRKGAEEGLKELQLKAMSIGTDADGGYAVPEDLDRMVYDLLVDISPMRQIASRVQVSTSDYKKLVNTRGAASGWVGEAAARPATATPTLAEIAPPIGEIYANAVASQQSLEDIFFNVEQFLQDNIATEFAYQEGAAFVSGNGTSKPKGFLDETTAATDDGVRAFGQLQYVATGVSADFAASPDQGDVLIDVLHKLKAGHRQGAVWTMNRSVMGSVRKLKDADGQYLWRPGLEAGMAAQLLGYGVVEMEDMPDIAADSLSIAFGNFQRGYLIVDRVGVSLLRDPYTNKPNVDFYARKRVGGKVIDSEAIKLVKFGVS